MAPPVGTPRRGRGPALLLAGLLVIPVVEIAAIIAVGRAIGGWQTFVLLLAESALGAWLVRREGSRAWSALSQALNSGRMPSRQLADAALVLVGGTLLLTPGFVTDIAGFFFILPFTRPIARRLLEQVVAARLLSGLVAFGPRSAGGAGPSSTDGRGGFPGSSGDRPDGSPGGPAGGAAGGSASGSARGPEDPDVIEGEIL